MWMVKLTTQSTHQHSICNMSLTPPTTNNIRNPHTHVRTAFYIMHQQDDKNDDINTKYRVDKINLQAT